MRTELPYDPEGIDPDFGFGARCASLRPALELYAEGELSGTEDARVVRRHVAVCTECRDRLARHDAQTRAILEDGAFEEGASLEAELRVARVLVGIDRALRTSGYAPMPAASLSPLSGKPSAVISAATPAVISAGPRGDFLRGFARLAAIVMISSGLGLLVAHEWAERRSDSPEAGARASFAYLDSSRAEAESALDADAFRWIADRVPEGFPEASGPLSLRLRGPRVAEAEGRHGEDGRARVRAREWIIEGVVGGARAATGPRYFLVRVDTGASARAAAGFPTRLAREGGAVEFRPSRCFAARLFEETADPRPRLSTREDEEVGVFRVCIVEEVRAFEPVVQVPDQVLEGAWLPWAPPSSRGNSRWIVPVGFDR